MPTNDPEFDRLLASLRPLPREGFPLTEALERYRQMGGWYIRGIQGLGKAIRAAGGVTRRGNDLTYIIWLPNDSSARTGDVGALPPEAPPPVTTDPSVDAAVASQMASLAAPEPAPQTIGDDGLIEGWITVDGDSHYPIHDPVFEANKLKLIADLKPVLHVNVGDHYDCWLVSSHEHEPGRMFTRGFARLQEEFDASKVYWDTLASCAQRVELLQGNHEQRLGRLVAQNPGLWGLRVFNWNELAQIPASVKVHRYGDDIRRGGIFFEHGNQISGTKYGPEHLAAYALRKRGPSNRVFGHFHRNDHSQTTTWDEFGRPHVYGAWAQGHGTDAKHHAYVKNPRWQQGMMVFYCYVDGGKQRFAATQITAVGGKFAFNGRVYR